MKDILKIIKIYLLKYKIIYLSFICLFAFVAFVNAHSIKKDFETGLNEAIASRDLNYTVLSSMVEHNMDYSQVNRLAEEIKAKNRKVSKEDFDKFKEDYVVHFYINHYTNRYSLSFYQNSSNLYDSEKFYNINYYMQFFNTEQRMDKNFEKLDYILKNTDTLNTNDNIETKNNVITYYNEVKDIYNAPVSLSFSKIGVLIKYNLDNNSDNLSVKEILSNVAVFTVYFIMTAIFASLVFGLEYHTNFGKFIASLHFDKKKIFFAKLLVVILNISLIFLIISLVNIWAIKTSVISDIVPILSILAAQVRIFFLCISVVILACLLASFSTSVVSILAMFLPVTLGVVYPCILFYSLYTRSILNIHSNNFEHFYTYIQNSPYLKLLSPIHFYVTKYTENKYLIIFMIILSILLIPASYLYQHHRVEKEGQFFNNKIVEKICYVIATLSFAIIPTMILVTLNIPNYIAIIISNIAIGIAIRPLFKLKIRV